MSGQKEPGARELPKGAVPYRSTKDYETGDWGVARAKIDTKKCTKCTLCHFFCPEGAIQFNPDGTPNVDYKYCKGCGICAEECPAKCIEMEMKK